MARARPTELTATWESTLTPLQSAVDSGCDPGEDPVDQFLTGTALRSGFSPGEG